MLQPRANFGSYWSRVLKATWTPINTSQSPTLYYTEPFHVEKEVPRPTKGMDLGIISGLTAYQPPLLPNRVGYGLHSISDRLKVGLEWLGNAYSRHCIRGRIGSSPQGQRKAHKTKEIEFGKQGDRYLGLLTHFRDRQCLKCFRVRHHKAEPIYLEPMFSDCTCSFLFEKLTLSSF